MSAGAVDDRRDLVRDNLRERLRQREKFPPLLGALYRALSKPRATRERAVQALIEEARQRAMSRNTVDRKQGLRELVALLSLEDWPTGAEWRGRLAQLLIVIGPSLSSRGPKPKAATEKRYREIAEEHARLELQGVRGQVRVDRLIDQFGN